MVINVLAQEDTLFIHISDKIDFYPINEIDSITFHYGNPTSEDTMLIWTGIYSIATYLVPTIDSISFIYQPTINPPLIPYCFGIPFFTDSRDMNVYRTVKIGNQCWLRENLRYLPSIFHPNSFSINESRYYVYDYLGDNIAEAKSYLNYQIYGALYNWEAASHVCPKGWKLPSNYDWDTLEFFLISNQYNFDNSVIENKIAKAVSGSKPQLENGLWTNSSNVGTPGNASFEFKRNLSGFSTLPAGYMSSGQFSSINAHAFFWSETNPSDSLSYTRYIQYDHVALENDLMQKEFGFSVRCISEKLSVFTDSVFDLRHNRATLKGTLIMGPEPIVQKGFYWKKTNESNWHIEVIQDEDFKKELLNLEMATTYDYFAYVISFNQTIYGDTLSFTTYSYPICPGLPTFVDTRDNEVYQTVLIGSQCWMKENLRYLPVISSINNNSTIPLYYVYGYTGLDLIEAKSQPNYLTYGVLYNRSAALNGTANSSTVPSGLKGICPQGWHVPSQNEYNILADYLGGWLNAGGAMKSNTLWSNSNFGSNSSFFTALPAGKITYSSFSNLLNNTYFWTATSSSSTANVAYNLYTLTTSLLSTNESSYSSSFSLRCVKNELVLSLDSVVNIKFNSATIYGKITPGYDSVYSKGISWKSINDSIWNYNPINNMSFSIVLNNLNPNTIYQVRCYNNDITGYKYSDTIVFVTSHIVPSPKIPYLYFSNNNSAIIKTTILPGTFPTFHYWLRFKDVDSLLWNYSLHSGLVNMDTLINLTTNHSYMMQVVLIAGNDTIYSPLKKIITSKNPPCPGFETIIDPRDNNVYNTVFINNTCWLKENLRYLPSVVPPSIVSNTTPYCYVYNFNDTNVVNAKNTIEYNTTGVLYNWSASLNGELPYQGVPSMRQGICPPGWQLPSLEEWDKLHYFIRQDTSYRISNCGAGSIAKSLGGSEPISQGGIWTDVNSICAIGDTNMYYKRNLTGMTLLPGGFLNYSSFISYNYGALLWTSTHAIQTHASGCQLSSIDPMFFTSMVSVDSKNGMSVRCVKQTSPIIKNINISNIFQDNATLNGIIIPGIYNIVTKGIKIKEVNDTVWNTIYLTTDTIIEIINNLDTGMTYVFMVFAYTNNDSIYSSTYQFQTLGLKSCSEMPMFIDSRDNFTYNTIQVGNQCWLRENLRFLPNVFHPDSISSANSRYYVYGLYSNNLGSALIDSNYLKFGTLYNYKSLKNVCPNGWHIPKTNEWDTLKNNLIIKGYNYTQQFYGNKIAKALSGSNPISNGGCWTDSPNIGSPGNNDFLNYRNVSSFNFIPSGYYSETNYRGKDSVSGYWIENIPSDTTYKAVNILYDSDSLMKVNTNSENAWYARCVKNINTNVIINITQVSYGYIMINPIIIPGNDYFLNYSINVKPVISNSWQFVQTYVAGDFHTQINNLQPDVWYHMIAEIRTDRDTLFTDTITFKTLALPPSFGAINFKNKEANSIKIITKINPGSSMLISKGLQYKSIDSINWNTIYSSSDSIIVELSGLMQKQKYNLRFFVHNVDSISYSPDTLFSTLWNAPCLNLPSFIDDRDSNSYRTIQIGNQCWMRENLRFLPEVYTGNVNSNDSARFYVPDYYGSSVLDAKNTANYNFHGVLYNAIAAKNGYIFDTFVPIVNQGICPIGWHLPSKAEYDTLFNYLKMNGYACSELNTDNQIVKSMVTSEPQSIGGLWTNSTSILSPGSIKYQEIRNNSGFSALPSGSKNDYGFVSFGSFGCFWTSSVHVNNAYGNYKIMYNSAIPSYSTSTPKIPYSVRCIKN